MARLLAMYKAPADPAHFETYYFTNHVPLAKTLPGLRRYEVSRGSIASPAGASGWHLIATLHFDDLAAIQKAFASPEGRKTAADLSNFASGGVELVFFDDATV